MLRLTLALLCLAVAAQAKTRVSRLPENVWRRPSMRVNIDERIVGGNEVTPHSRPYQVSLQYTYFDKFNFCGGAIISANAIMTAGHCCEGQDAEDLLIVAGEHSIDNDSGDEQKVNVEEFIIHDDFNYNTLENDICILKTATPITLGSTAAAATLPSDEQEFTGNAVVSGWGTLSSGGSTPDVLQSVEVPIVSDADCRDAYGEDDVYDSMICAGEEGHDSCQGDSGGPMTCGGVHCGIVSWGIGCAMAGYPGVYTQTSYFLDFINANKN